MNTAYLLASQAAHAAHDIAEHAGAGGAVASWKFWLGTLIFLATYVCIALENKIKVHQTVSALVGSSLMLLLILPGGGHKLGAYNRYVEFDVIFLLAGMMVIVHLLQKTGVFQYLAIKCAKLGRGRPMPVLALLLVITALLSAFLDNVTTVLLIAPVTLLVAGQLKIDPLAFLIPEALASNIGGTATLIGDPPNILVGNRAQLSFMDFIYTLSPFISILLAIFVGAVVLLLRSGIKVSAEQRAYVMELNENRAIRDKDMLFRGGIVMGLTLVGFAVHSVFHIEPGVVAMAGAALLLVVTRADIEEALEGIEWATLFFFLGLFIVVKGAEEVQLIDKVSMSAFALIGDSPYLAAVLVLWVSGICAGITNNVSFTAAALPVVSNLIKELGLEGAQAEPLWWALALGACLGGNFTPIGAAANLVVINIAQKGGYPITFGKFARWGAPCAFGSLVLATGYVLYLVHAAQP